MLDKDEADVILGVPTEPENSEVSLNMQAWQEVLSLLKEQAKDVAAIKRQLKTLEMDVRVVRAETVRHGRWLCEVLNKEIVAIESREHPDEYRSERHVLPDPASMDDDDVE